MAEGDPREDLPWMGDLGDGERGVTDRDADMLADEVLRDEAIGQLGLTPPPTTYQKYDLRKAAFWTHCHLPAGSVIVYPEIQAGSLTINYVAVMIREVYHYPDGIWVLPRYLGCSLKERHKDLQKLYRGESHYLHLCFLKEGECWQIEQRGAHVLDFEWYPPGDFEGEYLSVHAKKVVKAALKEASASAGKERVQLHGEEEGGSFKPSVEERLKALQGLPRTEAPGLGAGVESQRRGVLREPNRVTFQDGPAGKVPASSAALVPYQRGEPEGEGDRDKKKRREEKTGVGQALAQAARDRQEEVKDKKESRRSRSGSRKRKSKKDGKKRKKNSDSGSDESEEESSSSSASLMPPLRKKSRKDPGSVFRMLETQAKEHLADYDESVNEVVKTGSKGRMFAYFQIVLKPQVDARSRDCKEMAMLSKSLDLLKRGHLSELADVLAARLIAVDIATKQGWNTAKHLEVHQQEDEGIAPPHVLLAAQRHARQVHGEGRRQGLTAEAEHVELGCLATRQQAEGQRKGCKRKRKERQRKAEEPQRRMGQLAVRRKGEDRPKEARGLKNESAVGMPSGTSGVLVRL